MTAVPIWPGVTEYLYQAASPALVLRSGTCMVPSGLSPRRSSVDRTPIAGMATDTGSERRSDGAFRIDGPTVPAAEAAGDGACRWASTATPIAAAPPTSSAVPASPASLIAARPGAGGAGANWLSGHDMTTRIPPIRGQRPN